MDDISDITIDQARLDSTKQKMVTNFLDDMDKNDMHSLWEARKAFDKKIEKAFSGSPTLQNEMKRAFRNSVQQFIKDRTKNGVYQGYMDDMTGLFDLRDTAIMNATKERASSAFGTWMKSNPLKAQVVGWVGGAGALGYLFGSNNGGSGGSSN
jgi:hypothetical protein